MENSKERQLDTVFTARESGEYRFCFNNEMSTFAEKLVDFEIAVCSPLGPSLFSLSLSLQTLALPDAWLTPPMPDDDTARC